MFDNLKQWWGYNAPSAATSEGWDDHDKAFKANAPIRYFFNETIDEYTNKYWHHPIWQPFKAKYHRVRNRILPWHQYHIVKTGLSPDYHDKDSIMLHANFAILVDFVEHEKAWMETICHEEKYPKIRFWQKPFLKDRERGMTYLDWEISLDDPATAKAAGYAKPPAPWTNGYPSQAEAARQTKRLYIWWKDVYSKRKDPYANDDLTHLDLMAQEQKELDEETEALTMLIKIRKSLWT